MPPKCDCGQKINDETLICPACGIHIALIKEKRKTEMLEDAINGWRKSNKELQE